MSAARLLGGGPLRVPGLVNGAAGDCEAIGTGWLDQPVNALSSLTFVVAGMWVAAAGRSRGAGAAIAAVGVGSFWFHADAESAPARWAHDGSLVLLAIVAAVVAGRRATVAWKRLTIAAIVGTCGVALHTATRTGRAWCNPDSPLQGHAAWHVIAAATLALACWALSPPRPRPVGSPQPGR
jgi:hypothetical protein